MKQYLELLRTIKEKGAYKPAAREGMPGTQSLFGYQFRHNLQEGFPLLTTKKMFWKGVVVELLWFLRGDTNIKYLIDNGVNIWNEDAYNYYLKKCKELLHPPMTFSEFTDCILRNDKSQNQIWDDSYHLGDCGVQYGRTWRNFGGFKDKPKVENGFGGVDQIKNLIEGLKKNPESRRHIVSSIDPINEHNLALYWCHSMFQFNCRPLTYEERLDYSIKVGKNEISERTEEEYRNSDKKIDCLELHLNNVNIPKYYLDCQLYQRSADVFLGVPFNIASYTLLTELLAKYCNMIPGEFIHTFGDVHIYDNHKEAVEEQLKRTPLELPKLNIMFKDLDKCEVDYLLGEFLQRVTYDDFQLINYNPQSLIKAELSTGLKK